MAAETITLHVVTEGGQEAAVELRAVGTSAEETGASASSAAAGVGTMRKGFDTLKSTLRGLLPLVAGLSFAQAVKETADFQRNIAQIGTLAGGSRKEVDSASKGILAMAASVGTSPESLAQAMYHLESAGIHGADALHGLRIAAQGAQMGGANLTDTTTALTAVLVAGFRGVSTLQEAMGTLTATVGAGDMSFQDLNDALGTGILATAKSVGLQVKDVSAALAVMGDNNMRGAAAATRLRQAMMMMAAPTATAGKAMQAIGLSTTQLADDMRKPNGLMVALQDLRSHLQGMSQTQQVQALSGMFGGGRSSAGILTLINQMGRLQQKYGQVEKGASGFNQRWQETTQTLGFTLDRVKAFGQVLSIELVQGLQKAVEWLNRIGALKPLAIFLGVLTAAFIALKVQELAAGAGALFMSTDLGVAIGAMSGMADMADVLSIAIDSIPIVGWIALGITLLIELAMHWRQVVSIAVGAFHAITKAASAAWGWIRSHWKLLLVILTGPIGAATVFIISHFHQILSFIESLPQRALHTMSSLGSGMKSVFVSAFHGIEGLIKAPINAAIRAIDSIHVSIPHWVPGVGGHSLGFHIPLLHAGGPVPDIRGFAAGGAAGDIIPARLTPGEYVLNREMVGQVGLGVLEGWRGGGNTPFSAGSQPPSGVSAQQFAAAVAAALDGMGVEMDGQKVGRVLVRAGRNQKALH